MELLLTMSPRKTGCSVGAVNVSHSCTNSPFEMMVTKKHLQFLPYTEQVLTHIRIQVFKRGVTEVGKGAGLGRGTGMGRGAGTQGELERKGNWNKNCAYKQDCRKLREQPVLRHTTWERHKQAKRETREKERSTESTMESRRPSRPRGYLRRCDLKAGARWSSRLYLAFLFTGFLFFWTISYMRSLSSIFISCRYVSLLFTNISVGIAGTQFPVFTGYYPDTIREVPG
jgi:hypothetical protein